MGWDDQSLALRLSLIGGLADGVRGLYVLKEIDCIGLIYIFMVERSILVLGVNSCPTLYFGFMILYSYKMIITLTNLTSGDVVNLDQPILNAKTETLKMLSFKVGCFNIDEGANNNWVDVVCSMSENDRDDSNEYVVQFYTVNSLDENYGEDGPQYPAPIDPSSMFKKTPYEQN